MKSEKNRYICLYTQQTTESETRWKEEREGNFDKYKHYIDQCRQYTTQLVELNSSQYKEIYTKSMTLCLKKIFPFFKYVLCRMADR